MSKKTSEVARAYLVLSLCGVKPLVKHNAKVSPPPQTCLVVTAGSVPGHQASTVFYRCIVSFPHDGTGTIGWSDFREKHTAFCTKLLKNPILKFHVEMLLFNVAQGLRKCQLLLYGQNKNKNVLEPAPGGNDLFFKAKNEGKPKLFSFVQVEKYVANFRGPN